MQPEPYGVWGGLTAAERRVVLARRAPARRWSVKAAAADRAAYGRLRPYAVGRGAPRPARAARRVASAARVRYLARSKSIAL